MGRGLEGRMEKMMNSIGCARVAEGLPFPPQVRPPS